MGKSNNSQAHTSIIEPVHLDAIKNPPKKARRNKEDDESLKNMKAEIVKRAGGLKPISEATKIRLGKPIMDQIFK